MCKDGGKTEKHDEVFIEIQQINLKNHTFC